MKVMKQSVVYLFLALGFLLTGSGAYAWSTSSDCDKIKDADQKSLCYALTKEQPDSKWSNRHDCNNIKNDDDKAFCRALTSDQPEERWWLSHDCNDIEDEDKKNMCHELVKKK